MEELKKELERSQEGQSHLIRVRTRLQEESDKTSRRLNEIQNILPELIASTALGEAPTGKLETLKTELKKLREDAQDPAQEAIKIINVRIKLSSEKISTLNQQISLGMSKQRYQEARSIIVAKGFYTNTDMDQLEHLAGNSLNYPDLKRFTQAIDNYRYRRELHGQAAGFPAFEYTPEPQ